jgi:acetylornithine deacetylase/succinyl-diaminopimelate desuccinylase-like protein
MTASKIIRFYIKMNNDEMKRFIDHTWDSSITPALMEYIHIPNKSPMFDPHWKENGHMDKAVKLIANWCKKLDVKKMHLEVVELDGRTPVILMEIPGSLDNTILLYGHLDKQPEMSGWDDDLAPWKPVLKEDKLYGRGGADDGYAAFASLTAIKALQEQNIPHARCVILIEACEESGSYDLPFYIDALADRIGHPDLVICLDSGCGNYDQLWMTTSLRGLVGGVLRIDVLRQGIHSGYGSGIVPSCFTVLRQLLNRVEDDSNGQMQLADLQVEIPTTRQQQAEQAAEILKDSLYKAYPFVAGIKTATDDNAQLILNRTWRAALSVTGADGLPALENAGNVSLPSLTVKLSVRIPPTCDTELAANALKNALEINPPFGAHVQFHVEETGSGWNAPTEIPWLSQAASDASKTFFGKDAAYMGEGGSIPFMGMLGKKFPESQFLITGVLGPKSNAHGPNEFLHIPTGKKLTACVAHVIAMHFKQNESS